MGEDLERIKAYLHDEVMNIFIVLWGSKSRTYFVGFLISKTFRMNVKLVM